MQSCDSCLASFARVESLKVRKLDKFYDGIGKSPNCNICIRNWVLEPDNHTPDSLPQTMRSCDSCLASLALGESPEVKKIDDRYI